VKFAAMDRGDVENELLQLAGSGPSKPETQTLSAVDADPEPWGDEVDGAELLDSLVALLRRYVILPLRGAEVCALWVLHTFVFECFEYTPRLLVNSPDKRCGKSRLMRLVQALCRRPLSCEGASAAALFRAIDSYQPTLFLDEADTFLSGRNVNEDLRGVVNAGFQRGGKVLRCVGDDSEPTAFNCFAPVAIALIGRPPGTVEDRSIPIEMRRKATGERVEKFVPGQPLRAQFSEFVQRCVRWAADNHTELRRAQPDVPTGIDDRAADIWVALLAIADRAGGRWPRLAREVAVDVMGGRDGADSIGVRLLRDIRQMFVAADAERMSSAGIVAELVLLEDRPWPEYRNDRPITPSQLARLLKPFGVSPGTIRLEDGTTPKGYYRADFAEAWSRYLSSDQEPPPSRAATTPHTFDDKDLRPFGAATAETRVADENGHNPLSNKGCGGVAPPGGGTPGDASTPASQDLGQLVGAMAEELDGLGDAAPFRGEELRAFYQQLVGQHGVDVALADAVGRYDRQLLGEFLPLRRSAS
jgi:hypothetical protein